MHSALQVSTLTTGTSPDQDGYSLTVGEGPAIPIVNDTLAVPDLAAGSYAVMLGGLAGNCLVQGNNPRRVVIPSGPRCLWNSGSSAPRRVRPVPWR